MLFEVPGLNLGEPKVDDGKSKRPNKAPKKPPTKALATSVSSKKVQKPAKEALPLKSSSVTSSASLSIFKSTQKTKLQRKMEEKLMGSRFRYLNQKLYESDSKEALQLFKQNPEDFKNVRHVL